ncbi:RNA polymerase sigma factor [Cupriavidus basilensis]|uniref:RNA polymerase sigma factor n=1 Tax=Cupriavidus basilensis TaxID=68895 RepID=A0ABT6AHB9_9BURK|nr:RNA polymerase sigma factor [Cupriavidus basilensis]MDF3832000.1 RNA polymerase sigma factor [Cupriavidus basilensis]
MSEDSRLILLDYLGKSYGNLKTRLTRLLGNDDAAGDALHDTWLRLKGKDDYGPIQNPGAYLLRMAVNAAVDVQRRQSRSLSGDEVDGLLEEMADPAPNPAQVAEARSDLDALMRLLDRMPERRRALALLVHSEGVTQKEAARRLGVSLRTVEYELKRVHESLDAYMTAGKK